MSRREHDLGSGEGATSSRALKRLHSGKQRGRSGRSRPAVCPSGGVRSFDEESACPQGRARARSVASTRNFRVTFVPERAARLVGPRPMTRYRLARPTCSSLAILPIRRPLAFSALMAPMVRQGEGCWQIPRPQAEGHHIPLQNADCAE